MIYTLDLCQVVFINVYELPCTTLTKALELNNVNPHNDFHVKNVSLDHLLAIIIKHNLIKKTTYLDAENYFKFQLLGIKIS